MLVQKENYTKEKKETFLFCVWAKCLSRFRCKHAMNPQSLWWNLNGRHSPRLSVLATKAGLTMVCLHLTATCSPPTHKLKSSIVWGNSSDFMKSGICTMSLTWVGPWGQWDLKLPACCISRGPIRQTHTNTFVQGALVVGLLWELLWNAQKELKTEFSHFNDAWRTWNIGAHHVHSNTFQTVQSHTRNWHALHV